MHKTTSFEDDMRKFLSKKFWSHGTFLGLLGPLSQGDVILGFGRPQFLVILGPYSHFFIVACTGHAENPKLITAQCVFANCETQAFGFKGTTAVTKCFVLCSSLIESQRRASSGNIPHRQVFENQLPININASWA